MRDPARNSAARLIRHQPFQRNLAVTMPLNPLPAAMPYHPTTFQERGVALPFTTPLLGGARGRLSPNRGLELIVHNPAGGRGVYVMPWTAVTSLCRPTLHDKVLSSRIAFLTSITPTTVRAVAQATAAEGLAGEAAMEAARTAAKTDESDRRAAIHDLLAALIRQVNLDPDLSSEVAGAGAPNLDARARQTTVWLAQSLGRPADWGAGALHALADTMASVGVIPGGEVGRMPRLIKMLRETRAGIAEWIGTQRGGDRVSHAQMVCSVSDQALTLAGATLERAREQTDDMVGLLRAWSVDPDAVRRLAARPEWLLDGWEQICLLWNYAPENAARRAALVEIAEYLPALPREVTEWNGAAAAMEGLFAEHRPIPLNEDWRTGAAVFDLVGRNEQLRAAAS